MNQRSSTLPGTYLHRGRRFKGPGAVIILLVMLLNPLSIAISQVSFAGKELSSSYNRAMELYEKEKYPAAIRLFDEFIRENEGSATLLLHEAEYFSAISALRLFNADAEYRMIMYTLNNPGSPRLNDAYLELGNYFYQSKNYRKAAKYYETVNRQMLGEDLLPAYFFKYGYSLYMKGDKPKALLMFSEIKDIDTDYTPPAIYYFSQIAYEQKMYETALDGFMKLREDESFGSIVPFYIVQILYLKKDYDGILSTAPGLLKSAAKERTVELYRFIGDAYFNKGNFSEALPYLEKYSTGTKISGKEDKFQLGYCYYRTGNIDKAIKIFEDIRAGNDVLSQNIWNILGDCYLGKNDKPRARFAFGEASKLNFDRGIKEQALLNYAKISYEISNSPFGEAIEAFQEFINEFPSSARIQEAYDYLVGTYTQLKNYKAALASLDKIRNRDARLESAYQRVAFFRALEMFRNLELEPSIEMFDKSLKFEKYNKSLKARAIYWRGEALYRLGRYDLARQDYETFIALPGSTGLNEYKLVRYNLGSAYFNLKDYSKALANLMQFDENAAGMSAEVMADTKNRIADCYFIQTDYKNAIAYYDKVIDYGFREADYAMFQKGFSLGLINNHQGKVDVLTSLIAKFPESPIVPNAIYERGRAYIIMENFKQGEADFNSVIANYSNSPFVPRAMVQLGLLDYNLGNNDKAIAMFKSVIEKYKSTPEARYALTGLRNTYVEKNDVESYFAYVKSLEGYGDVNQADRDSLLYTSAENLYMSGKMDKAAETLANYIKEFPNGAFRLNAQFYLAETLRSQNKNDEALKIYDEIISQPNSQFMEQSLMAAASIMFDKEEFTAASEYYEKLEKVATNDENRITALRGFLRSASEAGDAQKTILAAGKIASAKNMPDELVKEAIFMNARANYSLNKFDEALKDFRKTATEITTKEGAESRYMVAELLYRDGKYDEAEKIVNDFVSQNTPHQYWMARMFLLLSDISLRKSDTLQARATLQSLKDYYSIEDDGIIDEVKSKLDSITKGNK